VPEIFSFIEAPDATLGVLRALVSRSVTRKVKRFFIDQEECKQVDLCAEAVASVLVREATRALRLQVTGRLPQDPLQRDVAKAAGLPRFLGAKLDPPLGFVTLGLVAGRKRAEKANVSSQREIVTTRLTNYVNACLKRYNWSLSRSAARYLSSIVGEVIGNAEDHSQEHSSEANWWVAAYLHEASDLAYGDCHITIFNFGRTLYESMQELPLDSLLRKGIESLVEEHTKRGFFSRPSWTPENLWTLYALQEGASRYQVGEKILNDRGQGTADMIQFFQRLGQSKAASSEPRMCIVSGRTHILFDNTYQMQLQRTEAGPTRRIIGLNSSNTLSEPPDERYVRHLESSFPGTLISLRFYLDEEHLNTIRRDDA
jgi:hypothetical protein